MSTIAERLQLLRGEKSRRSLAEFLGIPPSTLKNYEQGDTSPNLETLELVCEKMSISRGWLMLGEGPMRQGEADSQEQKIAQAPPPDEPPRAQGDESLKQMEIKDERLYQAWERERELMKEVGELKAENAMLKERITAREQALRDLRDLYELQELDIGPEETSAETALTKSFLNPKRSSTTE